MLDEIQRRCYPPIEPDLQHSRRLIMANFEEAAAAVRRGDMYVTVTQGVEPMKTLLSLHEFAVWASRARLGVIQGFLPRGPERGRWPWGSHTTDKLEALAAVGELWRPVSDGGSYDPEFIRTAPKAIEVVILAFAALLAGCAQPGPPAADRLAVYPPFSAAGPSIAAAPDAWEAYDNLGPGINFGDMLEAPREGDWGARFEMHYPAVAWEAGFRHARLPVRWSAHASSGPEARIDPEFLARVDAVVDALLAQGFRVVLNMHHYRQLDGDALDPGEARVEGKNLKLRFLAMWRQIGAHFSNRSDRLWFELYNEPHDQLTAAAWNDLASRALAVVRESNPTRVVVIGPVKWNSAHELAALVLPADPHLVATVHNYAPLVFTHQQATWAGPEAAKARGILCCDTTQRRELEEPMDIAQRWARDRQVPMWLGEFGSYGGPPEKPNDLTSRAQYARLVRAAANARGMAWAYWEFDASYGIYDGRARAWKAPLLDALFDR